MYWSRAEQRNSMSLETNAPFSQTKKTILWEFVYSFQAVPACHTVPMISCYFFAENGICCMSQ